MSRSYVQQLSARGSITLLVFNYFSASSIPGCLDLATSSLSIVRQNDHPLETTLRGCARLATVEIVRFSAHKRLLKDSYHHRDAIIISVLCAQFAPPDTTSDPSCRPCRFGYSDLSGSRLKKEETSKYRAGASNLSRCALADSPPTLALTRSETCRRYNARARARTPRIPELAELDTVSSTDFPDPRRVLSLPLSLSLSLERETLSRARARGRSKGSSRFRI